MPDSVRCSVDTSQGHHTVNCEVDIGPEPSASTTTPVATTSPATAAPSAPPPAASPAVTALVNRFVVSRQEVHAPAVDVVTASSVNLCAGQLTAVPVTLLALAAGPLAVLAGFKVGYDLGECLGEDSASRQLSADQAAAVKDCEAGGGAPTGFVEQSLMCRVSGSVSP